MTPPVRPPPIDGFGRMAVVLPIPEEQGGTGEA